MSKTNRELESVITELEGIASEVRFVKGRLRFGDGKQSAPFPSAVVRKQSWSEPNESEMLG